MAKRRFSNGEGAVYQTKDGTLAVRQAMTRARYAHGCGRPPTCGKRPVDCPQRTGHGPELADVKSRAGKRVLTLPHPLVEALRSSRRGWPLAPAGGRSKARRRG